MKDYDSVLIVHQNIHYECLSETPNEVTPMYDLKKNYVNPSVAL